MSWLKGSVVMATMALVACGGTAIIDDASSGGSGPNDDDGGTAAGGTTPGTPTGTPTGGPMPFEVDGLARESGGGWELRVVSFPIQCSTASLMPPYDFCGWYDISITLYVEDLIEGLVVPANSGQGDSFYSAAGQGNGNDCPVSGGGGGLWGEVSIVEVQEDRVTIQLGKDWDDIFFDGDTVSGEHTLELCN
jgi:hypothetical protein